MKKTAFITCLYLLTCQLCLAQAVEPASQPTNMQFSNIKPYSIRLVFTPNGSTGYLVLKSPNAISFVPADDTTYEKGQGLGNGCKVLAVGLGNNFDIREVLENTTYYFAVFAYNGNGTDINYRQNNPLTGSVSSTPANVGTYYKNIDSSSGNFITALHNLIRPHTILDYYDYKYNIVPAIYERDTTGGNCVVYCEYSNETTVYSPPFDFVTLDYSREHVLCKSWMRTYVNYGADVVDYPEGADYFNLLLAKLGKVNETRSNYPQGEVVYPSKTYKECRFGDNADGNRVFEPRTDRKGDAARCMMYEMICYNGQGGSWALNSLLSNGPEQSQEVLKQWNREDPPDKWERTKNEYIYSLQKNRNPFIDHPDWAECINFDNLDKTNSCGAISAIGNEPVFLQAVLFPNPANQSVTLQLLSDGSKEMRISVVDMLGREMNSKTFTPRTGINNFILPLHHIQNGNYLVKICEGYNCTFEKLLVIK